MGASAAERLLRKLGCTSDDLSPLRRICSSEAEYEDARRRLTSWRWLARPEQLAPDGDWDFWLLLAGRGFGKTRTGAEWTKEQFEEGTCGRFALVGPTSADVRDIMIEGQSGILSLYGDRDRPIYEPSKRRITWPNGAIATAYSAEEPDRLRGPQHDGFWADELAAWQDPQAAWDQLLFGLRLGQRPRGVVSTTPRPIALVRALLKDKRAVVSRGSTYDNAVNLAPAFLTAIERRFEGTRLGRQEISAEVLDDNPGALWKLRWIDECRVRQAPELLRVVVAIDPSGGDNPGSDEVGIGTAGVGWCTCKGPDKREKHGFVLDDESDVMSPDEWAKTAVRLYHRREADRVVAEANFGGDMVETTLRTQADPSVAFKKVIASRGKKVRAEPIAALAEQGKIHHVGAFPKLEDELTQWDPLLDTKSPNRLDWYVWAFSELMFAAGDPEYPKAFPSMKRRI